MFISQFEVQKASDLSLIEEIVRTDFHGNEKKKSSLKITCFLRRPQRFEKTGTNF